MNVQSQIHISVLKIFENKEKWLINVSEEPEMFVPVSGIVIMASVKLSG